MALNLSTTQALELWKVATVAVVRKDTADLTTRQVAVLLSVYLNSTPQTVRGLSDALNIAKPAVTRALDKLQELGLLKRKPDPDDKRSVLIQRTVKGSVYLTEFAQVIVDAAAGVE